MHLNYLEPVSCFSPLGVSAMVDSLITCSRSVVSESLGPPWTVAHQASLSMEISRQEYWNWLPFPLQEDLPYPGIEPKSPVAPALVKVEVPLPLSTVLPLGHIVSQGLGGNS